MALKDLVASNSALTEETVEAIVNAYIRYDIEEAEVVFLPEFNDLSNSHKILVFLSALQGWRFVIDDEQAVSMKPGELEKKTGIPGGSLRPALRTLAQQKLLGDKDGSYFARPASLASIRKEIESRKQVTSSISGPRRTGSPRKTKVNSKSSPTEVKATNLTKSAKKPSASGLQSKFDGLIEEDFFASARTLRDVQKRFHEEAVIIRKTSLPNLLLRGVKAGRLKRTKAEINSRSVWIYSNRALKS